jgi:hypothetical protein
MDLETNFLSEGNVLFSNKKYQEAVYYYTLAIQTDANLVNAYFKRG